MINLIKNELNKIFHNKGLFVLIVIVVISALFLLFFDRLELKSDDVYYINYQYEEYKKAVEEYDLSNKRDIKNYADDYAMYKSLELKKKYNDRSSPEYYYIENTIENTLINMYYSLYVTENEIEYNYYKDLYDSYLSKLNNFDWKADLKQEKQGYIEEKNNLEFTKNEANADIEEIQEQIDMLDIKISAIDYRLELEIPYAYTDQSAMVDEYLSNGLVYVTLEKDESLYVDKDELKNKRSIEENYKVALYKLENGIVEDSNRAELELTILSLFEFPDVVILLAMFIIIASVIADEFNKGTIKQLLLRPFTRSEILLSKIIASVIASIIFAFGYLVLFTLVYCGIVGDFGILISDMVVFDFAINEVVNINFVYYCLLNLVAILPHYLISFFFVFLVAVITTNAVGTISSGLGLELLYDMILLMSSDKMKAYIPFGCWDLSSYLFGGFSDNKYASLPLSICVCCITLLILIVATFAVFKRKDIKNQ